MCGGCGCARFIVRSVLHWCSATCGCSCVRSSMRFLNLWLQIALEWLHDCCHLVLPLVVMAASRLLGAAAACVILLSFAAGHCKSYWSGCIKAAIMICQQIFSILVLVIFRSNSFSKVLQNRVFFFFGAEIWLWMCSFSHRCASFYCVLQFISRYRIVVAASRLLVAATACVILLSLAAGH